MSEFAEVGPCRCGGYGVLFAEAHQRETGRCHEPPRAIREVERLRAVEAMAKRYAMAMGHAPLCASLYGSGGTCQPVQRAHCNCGHEALTNESGTVRTPLSGTELLRCPFCGTTAYAVKDADADAYTVACVCSANGPYCLSAEEAIAAWNHRFERRAQNETHRQP